MVLLKGQTRLARILETKNAHRFAGILFSYTVNIQPADLYHILKVLVENELVRCRTEGWVVQDVGYTGRYVTQVGLLGSARMRQ